MSDIKKEKKENNKFAVLRTGGKQYKVKEGDELKIEKLKAKEGETIRFNDVLLTFSGDNVKIGDPVVKGAVIEGKILLQDKGPKIVVFKMKAKKRYRKKTGHRQKLTKIKIEKIS